MATLLSGSAWAKISVFRKENGNFILQNVFISELSHVPNFDSIGQKIRKLEFWPRTIPKTA